jgi:hypothetical protein
MTDKPPHKQRGIFTTGAILLVVGLGSIAISPYFLGLYLLPVWIFVLGLILVWLSGQKLKTKIIWTLAPITVFVVYQLLWYQFNKAPAETFLIPRNFRGKIHIHFNEPCGRAAETERGRRLYKIPASGVLLSQFKDKQGFIDQQYFLVDSTGKRMPLPQVDVHDYNEEWTTEKNPHEPSRNILGIIDAGRVSRDGMYEFYVSTYNQLKDSFGFMYDKQYDSTEQKIIDACRQSKK